MATPKLERSNNDKETFFLLDSLFGNMMSVELNNKYMCNSLEVLKLDYLSHNLTH